MKKVLGLLAVSAIMVLFCACGKAGTPASDVPEGEADADMQQEVEDQTAEDQEEEEAVQIRGKEDVKVGVIYPSEPAEESGYTYTHDLGIQKMQKDIGLDDSQIVRKTNVSDKDAAAIETAVRECVEEGCNIIFATGKGYGNVCEVLAEEFPDVIFSNGAGNKSNGSNFNSYFGRSYQARYLAGIVAGLKTKSNKLGYVASMERDDPEVTGGINAFAIGAYSVNPDCEVYVKVTDSWSDPERETQDAQALIDLGCDVIAQHCDTPDPQIAAEQNGVWSIGYNFDMSPKAPQAVLTSVMWDWSVYYTWAVRSVIDGTWSGENYYGGMKEGIVAIAPLSDLCEEGTREAVDTAKEQIIEQGFNVFEGEIETNDGSTIGTEGSALSDEDITENMDWYFKNVVVK